jgi:hypothetical protein
LQFGKAVTGLPLTQQFGSKGDAVLHEAVKQRVDVAWKSKTSHRAGIEDAIVLSVGFIVATTPSYLRYLISW